MHGQQNLKKRISPHKNTQNATLRKQASLFFRLNQWIQKESSLFLKSSVLFYFCGGGRSYCNCCSRFSSTTIVKNLHVRIILSLIFLGCKHSLSTGKDYKL